MLNLNSIITIGVGSGGATGAIAPPIIWLGGRDYVFAPPIFETNFAKIVTKIPKLQEFFFKTTKIPKLQEFFFKTLKLPGASSPGPPYWCLLTIFYVISAPPNARDSFRPRNHGELPTPMFCIPPPQLKIIPSSSIKECSFLLHSVHENSSRPFLSSISY